MNNEFILSLENKIRGIQTRLKELHFSAPSITIHKLIDEFYEEFAEYEDALMENAQAIFGFIQPGDLNPVLPETKDFLEALEDIRGLLVSVKREFSDSMLATGMINLTDDFFTTVNKYIYLVKITRKDNE